jgi:hypothetical protein
MKRDQLRESMNVQTASQFEDGAANDNLNETGLQEYESSAGVYERRWRHRVRIRDEFLPETWWIVIALYLILISVAFVA